ncbi:hypothetical protein BRD56_10490 [Thermoplasmatales archaeon SW_10_69_26]|nr:MAG: hypothetical protein BRD56_10490 [Thermoplasmatales archaeon SW_10_69_26]
MTAADRFGARAPAWLLDDVADESSPVDGVLDYWEQRRPKAPYMSWLEALATYDRMQAEGELVPRGVLSELPTRLPDEKRIDEIGGCEGYVAVSCPDAGDGERHEDPSWRPYLSGDRWDPHGRSWNAFQGRGSTARDRFKRMAKAVGGRGGELGLIRCELTLPPELEAEAWGEIVDEGGGDFARLGETFLEHAWRLMGLPGEPVGAWVSIHRTSSSLPHQIRPHLHVWAPAVYRNQHGELRALEREPGSQRPLYRPTSELDEMRELWKDLLEDWSGRDLEGTQNLRYRPLWVRDREDLAKLSHGAKYNTRPHLEDVNRRLLSVGQDWVRLDVEDRDDLDHDTQTVPLDEFTAGVLTVQALTPENWQMSRWYGELGHRGWQAFADELGVPDPDAGENLWGQLEDTGWLAFVREDIASALVHEAAGGDGLDPPTPENMRGLEWRARDRLATYVTLPEAEMCTRCGQQLEEHGGLNRTDVARLCEQAIGDGASEDAQASLGHDPAEEDRDPVDVEPSVRRGRLIDAADTDRLRHDAISWRMRDHEIKRQEDNDE